MCVLFYDAAVGFDNLQKIKVIGSVCLPEVQNRGTAAKYLARFGIARSSPEREIPVGYTSCFGSTYS
jgi:hypothetical protein